MLGRPRVGQDAAVAERAGTELGSALHPSNHAPVREEPRSRGRNVVVSRHGDHVAPAAQLACERLRRWKLRPPEHVTQRCDRLIRTHLELGGERGTEGAARVVRRRLHEDPIEQSRIHDAAVHRAVVRDAARQAQPAMTGDLGKVPDQVTADDVDGLLERRGQIQVILRERLPPPARLNVLVEVGHAVQMQPVVAVRLELVQRAEQPAEARGIAIRRQPHHLVLVELLVPVEPDDVAIQEPQRMLQGNRPQQRQLAAATAEGHARDALSLPIERHDQRVVETRHEICADCVRIVVSDEADARRVDAPPELLCHDPLHHGTTGQRRRRGSGRHVQLTQHAGDVTFGRIERDRVEIVEGGAGLLEAESHRGPGRPVGVLDAIEAFLLNRGHHLAVADQGRRGVVDQIEGKIVDLLTLAIDAAREPECQHRARIPSSAISDMFSGARRQDDRARQRQGTRVLSRSAPPVRTTDSDPGRR